MTIMLRWVRIIMCALVLQIAAVSLAQATWLSYDEMYSGAGANGLVMSSTVTNLNGSEVTMSGYMAPPLKPSINFFVLTEYPMAVCPFCSTDADWPENIVVVYLDEPVTALPYDAPITVTGTLSVGSSIDAETGFVSLVRINAYDISQ